MDEVEWWEFDTAREMAEQAAGDIGFVIDSAIEAHGGARLALPAGRAAEPILRALLKERSDWAKVTLVPTDDRLVALDDPASHFARLDALFSPKGATVVSLVDEAALGDYREAGRLADARLALLEWPLDFVCLMMGPEGEVGGIHPGPDLDRALAGPRGRRATGVRPNPVPAEGPGDRVTLTADALASARTVMLVLSGAEQKKLLETAIEDGPLSHRPVGRLLAGIEVPVDIFWSAE